MMASSNPLPQQSAQDHQIPKKIWIYTNYDCNLSCSYCVAESSPKASRRALDQGTVKWLVDGAQALQFEHVYFTGGEPFLIAEIYEMLAYSSERLQTTVLTNAMLLHGRRLDRLYAIKNDNLVVQVSLDGCCPEHHDPYRGVGSWAKTVTGIRNLQEQFFRVRLSTTETRKNTNHLAELCTFHLAMGIPEDDHIIRPLAKRGFSTEGMEVGKHNLLPEITVNYDGVYWHPLSTGKDMQLADRILPLAEVICRLRAELEEMSAVSQAQHSTFQ
jgi:MoaA/NifB/PqqE/SkfB family radical SAM enzyme